MFYLFCILSLLFSSLSFAATEVRQNGTSKGYVNVLDFSNSSVSVSGIVGTIGGSGPTNLSANVGIGTTNPIDYLNVLSQTSGGLTISSVGGGIGGIDANTALLLHFNNNLVDSSNNNYSVSNSGVTFSSSTFKFSQYPFSGSFNGSANAVGPAALSGNLGTADFEMDMWVHTTLGAGNFGMISDNHSSASGVWKFFDPAALQFGIQGAFNDSFGVNVADGNWHLIEVDRHTGVFYYFTDGNLDATDSSFTGTNCGIAGSTIAIGINVPDGSSYTGFLDELRITVGTFRHTTSYTAPTSPYSNLGIASPQLTLASMGIQTGFLSTNGNASNILQLGQGSTAAINILSSENVGVGTANPGQILDVAGTMRSTGFTLTGHTATSGYVLTATDSAGDSTWSAASGGGNVGIGTANNITYWGASNTLKASNNLVFDGTNVGIGSVNPISLLDVNGNGIFGTRAVSGSTTPLNVSFGATYGTNTPGSASNLKWTMFDDGVLSDAYGIGMSAALMEFRSGAGADMAFYTNNGNLVERMASTGNVGIGTTSTNAQLELGDYVRIIGSNLGAGGIPSGGKGLELTYDTAGDVGYMLAYNRATLAYKKLSLAGSPLILNEVSEGNVGIGVGSPIRLFQSDGNAMFGDQSVSASTTPLNVSFGGTYGSNSAGNCGNLKWLMFDDGNCADAFGIGMSTALMEIHSGGGSALGFYTNNGTLSTMMTSSGNVGIGTTTAAYPLTVEGAVSSVVAGASTNFTAYNAGTGFPRGAFQIGNSTSDSNIALIVAPLYSNNSNQITTSLEATTDKTIGDSNQKSMLVYSSSSLGGFFTTTSDATAGNPMTFSTQSSYGSSPAIYIDNSVTQNIGIGSASPGQQLDVQGTIRSSGGFTSGSNCFYYCNGGVDLGVLSRGSSCLCPGGSCVATNICSN